MVDNQKRKKVTLVWNGEDVARVWGVLIPGWRYLKYIDAPLANYSTLPFDKVLKIGDPSGYQPTTGYTYNERAMISLAVDSQHSEVGPEVAIILGEGGSRVVETDGASAAWMSENPGDCLVSPLRQGARVAYRPPLSQRWFEKFDGITSHQDNLPKLISVVPGRERTFFTTRN